MIFRNFLNNLENWCQVLGPLKLRNLLQLLNSQLCQDSSVSFFLKRSIRDKWKMSTIKNGHILPYCRFNKIIKGPGTSFQSPPLSKKHNRSICQATHYYLPNFQFESI